jgi:hypothetical protein
MRKSTDDCPPPPKKKTASAVSGIVRNRRSDYLDLLLAFINDMKQLAIRRRRRTFLAFFCDQCFFLMHVLCMFS